MQAAALVSAIKKLGKGEGLASAAAALKGKRVYAQTRGPIGIDVGSRAVKAVQLGRDAFGDGTWQVVAATSIPRSEVSHQAQAAAGGQAIAPAQPRLLAVEDVRRLVGTLERQGFEGGEVCLAVPTERLTTTVLDLPPRSSQAPLEQIARMELARTQKCAPDSFEMGCWDLPAAARATKATPVMAVACTHADATAMLDPFEAEGLDVGALDVRPAALARACAPLVGDPATLTAILDVGWAAATLSVMYQGVVVYVRTLGEGGVGRLYQSLSVRLKLDEEVIDYLLAESGLGDAGPQDGIAAERRAPADASGLIATHFEAAVQELRVSFQYAQHQYHERPVSRLLLTGGGACIRGVAAHVSKALGVEVRNAAPADLTPVAPAVKQACQSPALTLALGLARYPEGLGL